MNMYNMNMCCCKHWCNVLTAFTGAAAHASIQCTAEPFHLHAHSKCDKSNDVLQQYWDSKRGSYSYVSVAAFAEAFQQTEIAKLNMSALEEPYVAPNAKCDQALITHKYALPCTFSALPFRLVLWLFQHALTA